ncbi:MAG: YfcE family phosphodiesterase [Clostridia bacterium]|nr:YfcE family phosphodiesterase [Clostridia bacterium]
MEFLIVSDTHGRADRLAEVLARTRADVLLFLGDGLRDLNTVPAHFTVRAVRGNCDWMSHDDAPGLRIEDFGTTRIFLTHGHRYGVKGGFETAAEAAAKAGADVLLYGHTHRPLERMLRAGERVGDTVLEKPLLVLCPGSLGEPPDGKPSFATLTLCSSGLLAGFGTL